MIAADDVRIRCARPEDARAVHALEALFPSDRMSLRSVRRFLRVPTACVLIAEAREEALGNLLLLFRRGSRLARIYSVAVSPQARGLGLGTRLVEAAEAEAVRRGAVGVTLEVRSDNLAARALYAKLGYAVERMLPGFYDDGADGYRLTRRFAPAP